ncbi:hypothetical protein GWI33_017146 [Rhynchophorus ferrugineus]|uniref:Uncharacterized protein n=1 Tax=Rhynchophorus ferrugineus TaxID=354439 RepID=A0A834M2N7_RHYFE|nr:hypothetical protein GWI33_017146 [Rhynchophorus ferrugineus]
MCIRNHLYANLLSPARRPLFDNSVLKYPFWGRREPELLKKEGGLCQRDYPQTYAILFGASTAVGTRVTGSQGGKPPVAGVPPRLFHSPPIST